MQNQAVTRHRRGRCCRNFLVVLVAFAAVSTTTSAGVPEVAASPEAASGPSESPRRRGAVA